MLSWIERLSETYDLHKDIIGKEIDGVILLPISHSTQNAQLEVTIDINGNFLGSTRIGDKKNAVTIIPVTEDSASRGSGITPHPLCDKLQYVAGDYLMFVDIKDEKKKEKLAKYYLEYIKRLKDWSESKYSHEKVNAIYKYLSKKTLISDLLTTRDLNLEDKYLSNDKIQGIVQADAFVRFIVLNPGVSRYETKVWEDQSLYEAFVDYYENVKEKEETDYCYVTGNKQATTNKHVSKIRHSGDKAKIISANDTSGFTYRGRFNDSKQAVSVGYETSQKAHLALRWLIQKQGYTRDGACIVAWALKDSKIPNALHDNIVSYDEDDEDYSNDYTAKSYSNRLNSSLNGYRQDLKTAEKIIIMGMDAATTGRLAITYYREIDGHDFLDRIEEWYRTCYWKINYRKNETWRQVIGTPIPREISLAAFGTEQGNFLKADDKLIRTTVERLLPCIIDGQKLPYDIMRSAVNRANSPLKMSKWNWNNVVNIACALVKKYQYDYYKEEWDMALKQECIDRSYLFGRLLAIAEKAEYSTFDPGEKRATNARRYWDSFSREPAKTWRLLYGKLIPYLEKLNYKVKYINDMNEIIDMMSIEDFNNDQPLEPIFLLGYASQAEYMRSKKGKQTKEEEDNE